jgi:orotidine-5'-phosphate decarboxylase
MQGKSPLICAIDTADLKQAVNLATLLKPTLGFGKLGLEFFLAHGPEGVRAIAKAGLPIFLDLKFLDIPNTVAGAIRSAAALGVEMLTVHTSGGSRMMKAAAEAAKESKSKRKPMLLGVTVLTSMEKEDMAECGISRSIADQVLCLADLALNAGLDGLVCSPHEVALLKKKFGKDLKLIVPGIRPKGSEKGDQRRTMTPAEALRAGADYLVIGRPIMQAADPLAASKKILKEIN